MGVVPPLWAEPRPKNVFLGGIRFQVKSSPRGFVESVRGFGIWLAQWHLHSPTELDFSFSSQGQGHKVTNLENVKKINKLGIELLGFSTVSNESWYASSALRVLQLLVHEQVTTIGSRAPARVTTIFVMSVCLSVCVSRA